MNLTEKLIKSDYDSSTDDMYNDFYAKILGVTSRYNRLGGFFSSETLSLCAEGLQQFIKNNGRMKLILIPRLSQEDIKSIHEGILTPEKHIDRKWIRDFDMIKDKFQSDHVRALAWMLANKFLEIRIALIKDLDGNFLDFEELETRGIINQQIGTFHDDDGNSLSFRGTISSLDNQRLRVFKNWIEGQKDYVTVDNNTFQKFWELDTERLFDDDPPFSDISIKTIPLTQAIRDKFLEFAPDNIDEINLIRPPKLYEYQTEAIHNWISNNGKGIFEMATGTGKTFTAIGCVEAVKDTEKSLLVVVVCPYINLVYQWKSEVTKWGYKSFDTLGQKQKWLPTLTSKILDLQYGTSQGPLIIVTTYDTFSSNHFRKLIEKLEISSMLIADEAHAAGADQRKLGLMPNYKYRLGLSATPDRYFDDEGTQTLLNYFHGTVYRLSLADAINRGFLCGYEYYPYFVGLTQEELRLYRKLTQKIARLWNDPHSSDKKSSLLELYIFQRTRIVNNAQEKIKKFKEIVEQEKKLDYTLVYCSELQITDVQRILDSRLISNHRITADIPKKPEDRVRYLEFFEAGLYDVIVAIRVLDEGLNIPAVKNAIILASTGNPKQYIQRRGRVLRKYSSRYKDGSYKEFARIFDVLVIPEFVKNEDPVLYEIERSIIKKEIVRYEEMVRISRNSENGLVQLQRIKKIYDL